MDELKQIVFTIFNTQVKDADVYYNNGSTWLIFTNKKKWVFELTKEGTLWYNYYFFKNFFELLSLEVIENQNYITEWVEDFIQNGVKHTASNTHIPIALVDDTIQNGVKETTWTALPRHRSVEDTIQNGVKETKHNPLEDGLAMEEVIQNGIKVTIDQWNQNRPSVKDVLKNGVKETHLGGKDRKIGEIKDIVENGVKETKMEEHHRLREVVQTVKNGVKETNPHFLEILNPINFEPVIKEMKRMNEVDMVLDKGIKEVKELPDKSGMLMGYGEYYARQENKTYPHTEIVNDVIRNGIKETKYCELHSALSAEHIIRDGIKETWGYAQQPQIRVNEVINVGIKETNWRRVDNHPTFLDNIIKSNN